MEESCYFCENTYVIDTQFITNINGNIWICFYCEDFCPFKLTCSEDAVECPICYDNKNLYNNLNCNHQLCLDCIKKNYFGYSNEENNLMCSNSYINTMPDFPINEDDNDYEEKWKLYEYYDDKYFNIEKYSLDELINIRNGLILERPEWMNTDEFIKYENERFKFHKDFIDIDNKWNIYNENKIIGSKCCPICRK